MLLQKRRPIRQILNAVVIVAAIVTVVVNLILKQFKPVKMPQQL